MTDTRICEYDKCQAPYEPVVKDQRFHSDACRSAYHRERPQAISGTRRQLKEMADGTLRVQIDIDPRFKKLFHELFPDIDTPVALAPLKNDFDQPKEEKKEEPKGGPLARLAGMFCNDPNFSRWLNEQGRFSHHESLFLRDGQIVNPAMARADILETCKIQSRKELDSNPTAARIFHEQIRLPYSNWLDKQQRPGQ